MSSPQDRLAAPPSVSNPLTGSCLCGRIRYEIVGKLGPLTYCHCGMCQKAQGAAFGANAPVRRAYFEIKSGEDMIVEYESSPEKWRSFCRACGSPLYSRTTNDPDIVRIRIGLLDGPPSRVPAGHGLVEDKADWYCITDDLPFFDASGRQLSDPERAQLLKE